MKVEQEMKLLITRIPGTQAETLDREQRFGYIRGLSDMGEWISRIDAMMKPLEDI